MFSYLWGKASEYLHPISVQSTKSNSTLDDDIILDDIIDESFSDQQSISSDKRLNNIFQKLFNNEDFKNLWKNVNENLHKTIELIPSPPPGDKDYVSTAKFKNRVCPVDCPKINFHSSYPHTFQIFINLDNNDLDISNSIIFETCNASLWPEHKKYIIQDVRDEISEDDFAEGRERVEHEALKAAKIVGDKIDKKIFEHIPKKDLEDFRTYLQSQKSKGHYDVYKKHYWDIRKASPKFKRHKKTSSMDNNNSIGVPSTPSSNRRRSVELVSPH